LFALLKTSRSALIRLHRVNIHAGTTSGKLLICDRPETRAVEPGEHPTNRRLTGYVSRGAGREEPLRHRRDALYARVSGRTAGRGQAAGEHQPSRSLTPRRPGAGHAPPRPSSARSPAGRPRDRPTRADQGFSQPRGLTGYSAGTVIDRPPRPRAPSREHQGGGTILFGEHQPHESGPHGSGPVVVRRAGEWAVRRPPGGPVDGPAPPGGRCLVIADGRRLSGPSSGRVHVVPGHRHLDAVRLMAAAAALTPCGRGHLTHLLQPLDTICHDAFRPYPHSRNNQPTPA
jgi:hypothetical protein